MAKYQDSKQAGDKKLKSKKLLVNSNFKRSNNDKTKIFLYLVSLIILTIIVFSNSLENHFITNFDDNMYLNFIQSLKDLSSADLNFMFTSFMAGNYHPLSILSLTIDFHFHGMNAYPFHIVNLIIHLTNVILVFWLIYIFINRFEAAVIVSLFFAVHPMHVESISWISERKDVLYTFFFLLSLISYIIFLKNDNKYKFLALSLVFFILSLLSKPAAICLSPVVVLIDYYKRRKFSLKVILEKIPFFILSITFGIIAVIAQKSSGALNNISPVISFFDRIFLISFSTMFYIVKAIFPLNLSAFYFYPDEISGRLPLIYYFAPFGIALIVFLIVKIRSIRQELIFGFTFYIITIALVLQFLPVGIAIVAERYSYVPFIGLFFILGKLYCDFVDNKFRNYNKAKRNYLIFIMLIFAAFFSYSSHERNKVWKDGIVLFSDVIEKDPNGYAYLSRGNLQFEMKDYNNAISDYNEAIKHNYKHPVVYFNKAACYEYMDSVNKAIKGYNEALKVDSTFGASYFGRANVKQKINDFKGAIKDYKKAIKYNYNLPQSYNAIGFSLLNLNDYKGAISYIQLAIKYNPKFSKAYNTKGTAEYFLKEYNEALNDFNKSILYDTTNYFPYFNRALVKLVWNDLNGACDDFNKALLLGYKPAEDAIKQHCNNLQKNNTY